MGGKAALIVILGFSAILLVVGLNMGRVATSAVDNSSSFYENEMAKEIARTGINLAASNLSRNHGWTPNSSYDYMGNQNLKITLTDSSDITTITSVGTYQDKTEMIEVKLRIQSFSEYAYFSDVEGNIWWSASDSVWGPFHTNDNIQVQGHPYFAGPTMSHGGAMKYYKDKATDAPTIVGTYTPGLKIDIPTNGITNLQASAAANGVVLNGSIIYLEFVGDSIRYSVTVPKKFKTVLGSDFAPNGVIYANNADIRIEGTVKGQWSVGSNRNVYIDNDIVYSNQPDPMDKNDPSQDLLGIISQNNVIVADNTANHSDVNINAAIYCQDGSFTVENYASRVVSGTINLLGGITQKNRGAVGTFSIDWSGKVIPVSGFAEKDYKYDSRLLRMVPPYFPSTNTFKILSWLE